MTRNVQQLFDLTGKTALVTGGSRGLGLQMAEALGELAGPGPAVTLVPIETNCFDGLSIEIEGIAMRGHNGERLAAPHRGSPMAPTCRRPSAMPCAARR